ncbi:putative TLC domain [Monocercomonoides exilis]|uniref:putative TLC domain n=1 Tax=Monocercomonoides exilis TaxID=2049356 RepID=UPI00355A5E97|nr:putative TLC domain [Monocercomonoides exilis]
MKTANIVPELTFLPRIHNGEYNALVLYVVAQVAARFLITTFIAWIVKLSKRTEKPHHPKKAAESFYFGLYYLSSWIFSNFSLHDGNISVWQVIKHPELLHKSGPFPQSWKHFINYELAHYITCMIYYKFDNRQHHTDYYMMMLHHICCIFLMFTAQKLTVFQPGLIYCLFLHDWSDIWMEFGKVLLYMKIKLFILCLGVLVPSWFILRCIVYPATAIRSGIQYFDRDATLIAVTVFEIIIWIMNCIWFVFIFQMVLRSIKGSLVKDVRSEDESDETISSENSKEYGKC